MSSPIDLTLPAPAANFVPHRPPMLQIETLEEFTEAEVVVSAHVSKENPLVDEQGNLMDAGLIEMMAQAYAARQGYADRAAGGAVREGYLVGLRDCRVLGRASLGDRLIIRLRGLMVMDGFALAEGGVFRGEDKLAEGTLKLWIRPTGEAGST